MEQKVQGLEPAQPKSSKKKIGCWIVGCLTVLVIGILFVTSIVGVAFWATKGPVKVIQEQLSALRRGDIEGAYLLTSGDFHKVTNLDRFKQFINTYPLLAQNKKASFSSRKIENDKGYVSGTLTAADGSSTPINYDLIKENGEWKILYMEVSPTGIDVKQRAEQVDEPAQTVIERVDIGTVRNPDGSIADSGSRFPQGTGEIKVSAYIAGARNGQNVSCVWYFGGQQITDPVVNVINGDGDFISQFSLNPPDNGWPTGGYKVVVSIDNQITEEVSYFIGQ